jgi:hypothetical protein
MPGSTPGFPTVHSLEVWGELKNAGVNVFGTSSKKESLILRVGKGGDPQLTSDGHGRSSSGALLVIHQHRQLVSARPSLSDILSHDVVTLKCTGARSARCRVSFDSVHIVH